MELKKITTAEELHEAIYAHSTAYGAGKGRFVELEVVDGTIKGARVGGAFFRQEQYGNFGIFREAEYKEADRYRLIAKAPGFGEQRRYFEDFAAFLDARREYGDHAAVDDSDGKAHKVALDDEGNVIGEMRDGKMVLFHNEGTATWARLPA